MNQVVWDFQSIIGIQHEDLFVCAYSKDWLLNAER